MHMHSTVQGADFQNLGSRVRDPTCDVDAVGMGASSSELRTPCAAMSLRRRSHSQRLLGAGAPHMSCCSCPRLTGEPAYVSYGPAGHAEPQVRNITGQR